jgi:hypothetical protein
MDQAYASIAGDPGGEAARGRRALIVLEGLLDRHLARLSADPTSKIATAWSTGDV